ncbi:hypothetical protein Z517_02947 [Fonsecaea pedrosoi CBS 271.37]|uniref:Uncharacterized protein n=1 Tax=Fonsecaea pedrosoi CBS 271.37 TaxID=1442368 RepID=A0A0D2E0U8_9EURO|nr:uncharacterized protein Z517_02947 [Fonsecaea pedrosoi CBS 271.37]KIW83701.1 hypothetical protein Z517_02947 [Fonsecaea pedrosoi CBS 271.37]
MPFLKLIPVERSSTVNDGSSSAKGILDGYITGPNSKDNSSFDDKSGCQFLKLTPDTATNINMSNNEIGSNKNNINDNNNCHTDVIDQGHQGQGQSQNQAQSPGQDKDQGSGHGR